MYCCGYAQDSSGLNKLISLPDKFFSALDKKTSSIEGMLNRQTEKYLSKLQRQERKLKKKLYKKDSVLANQLFDGVADRYEELKRASYGTGIHPSAYSAHFDSLSTALSFLKNTNLSGNAFTDLNDPALQRSLEQYRQLQQSFNGSAQLKKYLAQRQYLLKQQFERLGMVKQLKRFRKQVYYYQAQVRAYKELFEDPSKLEAKLMQLVMKFPQFKDFFAKNSMLGSLFGLPGASGVQGETLAGLQTRAMVSQLLTDRFGGGTNVTQQLQQNVQSARSQLNQLKNKLDLLSPGNFGNSSGNEDLPGFKPNSQKTKSFLKRLEYGANVQSQRARYFFPVTSDIALSLGYKINDRSSIGIGAAYKMGWGKNWNNIRITHQGIGLRSYLDWKIKGSFYISGGYEQNYRPAFGNAIPAGINPKEFAWQSSGLLGLSKKYQITKKMKGEVKLLWDFMSYQQVPKAQPILFRIGYSLK